MPTKYDFSGYATRSNILCSDGRVIANNAFAGNDGQKVPLIWQHKHDDPKYVLGHALLENRGDGVYAYGCFNDSENGRNAKILVESGDVAGLSIYANQLEQDGSLVSHGNIREVSLVLAGANPEAYIENILSQSGIEMDDEAIIHTATGINTKPGELEKDDEDEDKKAESKNEDEDSEKKDDEAEDKKDSEESDDDKPKDEDDDDVNDKDIKHGDDQNDQSSNDPKEKTVQEVYDTFTDEQRNIVDYLIGIAVDNAKKGNNSASEGNQNSSDNNNEGGEDMKHNVFEGDNGKDKAVLQHDAMVTIIADAKRCGSLRESVLQHSEEYGITNIEYLFPDAQKLENTPGFIKKTPDNWVTTVMNGVHHTPFSRVKMVFADITADEARAKGYVKGNRKIEEVFSLLKRTVDPTTVYKKQKLDRDDITDITDFDVVSWLKTEMRMMLDEELARAFIFGDGRLTSSDDKIDEAKIIPVVKDNSLYTITKTVTPAEGQPLEEAFIDAAVLAKVEYQGSGNTTAFVKPEWLARTMLLKDGFGHRLYKDTNELALAMGVKRIEEVPSSVATDEDLLGVILDLADYNVGADKGGSVNMFDDFDIDYNQQKYLIETRCSGALTKPYSAIVLKKSGDAPVDPSES